MPSRKPKPRRGRPRLGRDARTIKIQVRITEAQHQAIEGYVAKENVEIRQAGGDGTTATVSSWVRDVIEEAIP